MRLFSQMTLAELQEEMERLLQQIDAVKQGGPGDLHVLEQKFFMAKSYFVGTDEFRKGKSYRVHGVTEAFTIEYFNGVFAWGRYAGSSEVTGVPVGKLEDL